MAFRVDHNGFNSSEYNRKKYKKYTMRYFGSRFSSSRSSNYDGGASMLAKMSLCALLCALALGANHMVGGDAVLKATSALSAGAEHIGEEYLGKLRFVELPGIIEVFSPSAKMRIGCSFRSSALKDDGLLLAVEGASGQVSAPASGTVKTVAEDDGRYSIDIVLQNDIVVRYLGLTKATVEEGQRISMGDTLGDADGLINICVWAEGRPEKPEQYFDTSFSGA